MPSAKSVAIYSVYLTLITVNFQVFYFPSALFFITRSHFKSNKALQKKEKNVKKENMLTLLLDRNLSNGFPLMTFSFYNTFEIQ